MGNCCISLKEDLYNEIRKDAKLYDFETKDNEDYYNLTSLSKEKNEQILFEIKDNPYEEYSKSIFLKFNEIRLNPSLFFKSNTQYNLQNEYEENALPSLLTWSTKKSRKISDYFQNRHKPNENENTKSKYQNHTRTINEVKELFKTDFIITGYYSYGKLLNVNQILINLFSNTDQSTRKKIILNDYSYCVIYSDIYEKNTILSYFFFFKHI